MDEIINCESTTPGSLAHLFIHEQKLYIRWFLPPVIMLPSTSNVVNGVATSGLLYGL